MGILNTMNEGMNIGLMMVEVIALIAVFLAVAGFAIYLGGVAWLCFEEMRRSSRRQMRPSAAAESDDFNLIGVSQAFPPRS